MRKQTEGFLHPHGFCYLWNPSLVWSHVAADLLIGAAYVAISATLAYFVYRVRHLLPFHWMFLAFGLFILTCGGTHFMEVWTLWFADFWASAALKIVTAVSSVATALTLPALVPQAVRLIQAAAVSEKRLEELERARHEQEEAEAQSRAKDLFLATLSHELRTPLNVVGGWARMIAVSAETNTSLRKAADAIQRNVALQTRLVEDMLDVSSILTGRLTLQRQMVDLVPTVGDSAAAMKAAAAASDVRFECEFPKEPLRVLGDPARIQQVVNNLLTNAVKFSERGGLVHVAVRRHATEAEIVVTDTGRGIDPAFLPKMFDPFAQEDQSPTRTAGGLGLGLAIVRHLVERHDGRLVAESEGVGRGATFRVFLPVAGGSEPRPMESAT
jgi:signal transduction histidine kinase